MIITEYGMKRGFLKEAAQCSVISKLRADSEYPLDSVCERDREDHIVKVKRREGFYKCQEKVRTFTEEKTEDGREGI